MAPESVEAPDVAATAPRSPRTTVRSVAAADGVLVIGWADGHDSRFPFLWLRDTCTCPVCGSTESARRLVRLTDLPTLPRVAAAAVAPDGGLDVEWAEDGHRSHWSAFWLRGHCLSAQERQRRRFVPTLWGPEIANAIPRERYPGLADDDERRLRFLEQLRDIGFVVLEDVPADPAETEAVTRLVGILRITNYGIFDVLSKPTPELVGDTAAAQTPHTDEPYRHHPPGVTFFHFIAQADEGGANLLVDGYRVAERLRREAPEAFAILSTVPATFHRTLREGRAFHAAAPIIRLDRDGAVAGLRLLDRGTAPPDLPEADVLPYYAALRRFLGILYDPSEQLAVKLMAGQVLVFNNHRLLHGRTGFDPTRTHRHMRTANVDLDEFYSSLRVLYRRAGDERAFTALPQGANP